MKKYRHGDVIITEVSAVKGKELDHLTLALGEVTGHSHRISSGVATLFAFDNKKYLDVQSDLAVLTHEEHKALELPRGKYEIVIQREYKPEGWGYVAD